MLLPILLTKDTKSYLGYLQLRKDSAKTVPTPMSLYKRGNVYWSRIKHRGVLRRRSLQVSTRLEALKREAAFRIQLTEGRFGLQKAPTLVEFTEKFINYLPARVAPETYRAYMAAWKRAQEFLPLANARLDEIDTPLLDQYSAHLKGAGLSTGSINLQLRVIRRALSLAKEWRIISHKPTVHLLRGENTREYVISEADEPKIIEAIHHPTVKALIPFMIDTGLRRSEACALTWTDVTETTLTVQKGKTKNARRTIPLTDRAQGILKALLVKKTDGSKHIFTQRGGLLGIGEHYVYTVFKDAARKVGLPEECVLHSTRHTFCTRLGKAGCSPFELMKLAGHGSITISARYCHPDTEQLTNAISKLNGNGK